jgi:hypothetical protein
MSHQGTSASHSRVGYTSIALDEQEDKDPRSSVNSSSPILLALESNEFDGEGPLKPTTFQVDGLETFYKPIEDYEGAHRYDPEYTWNVADEKKVVRKVTLLYFDQFIRYFLIPG